MNKKGFIFIILSVLAIVCLSSLFFSDTGAHEESDKHTKKHKEEEKHQKNDHSHNHGHDQGHDHGHDHVEGGENEICKEHDVLEAECGICGVNRVPELGIGKGLKIRMVSLLSAKKAGVETVKPVLRAPLTGIQMSGKITYNYHRLAHITALAGGVTGRVLVQNGDYVKKGQLLLEIRSNDIVSAKEEYLNAMSLELVEKLNYEREKKLRDKEISAARDYELALARYRKARQKTLSSTRKLVNLGFSKQHFKQLEESRAPSPVLPVPAPFTGTIVFRHAVRGEAVESGKKLLTLADLSQFWLELSIPERHLPEVRLNAMVKVLPEPLPDLNLESRLTWISSDIDEQTRTLKGRAILDNPEGMLKHGMYAHVFLQPREIDKVLTVPAKSLHIFSQHPFLFVKLAEDLYEVRRVVTGSKQTGKVEILEGLKFNEIIVADHSFIIKSELLKSRLGAGCVDH
jgi:cobalt-zinc-cadmium efflux system membrane fusion protein